MPEIVYVAEYGCGARPAIVLERYTTPSQTERVKVEFKDERGGRRDCFAKSVFADRESAERQAE